MYPIGTRVINTKPKKGLNKWWILIDYSGKDTIWQNDSGETWITDHKMVSETWRLELPKEDLFDKLYERLL